MPFQYFSFSHEITDQHKLSNIRESDPYMDVKVFGTIELDKVTLTTRQVLTLNSPCSPDNGFEEYPSVFGEYQQPVSGVPSTC